MSDAASFEARRQTLAASLAEAGRASGVDLASQVRIVRADDAASFARETEAPLNLVVQGEDVYTPSQILEQVGAWVPKLRGQRIALVDALTRLLEARAVSFALRQSTVSELRERLRAIDLPDTTPVRLELVDGRLRALSGETFIDARPELRTVRAAERERATQQAFLEAVGATAADARVEGLRGVIDLLNAHLLAPEADAEERLQAVTNRMIGLKAAHARMLAAQKRIDPATQLREPSTVLVHERFFLERPREVAHEARVLKNALAKAGLAGRVNRVLVVPDADLAALATQGRLDEARARYLERSGDRAARLRDLEIIFVADPAATLADIQAIEAYRGIVHGRVVGVARGGIPVGAVGEGKFALSFGLDPQATTIHGTLVVAFRALAADGNVETLNLPNVKRLPNGMILYLPVISAKNLIKALAEIKQQLSAVGSAA